jgi:PAS domain S-box-containing protein
VAATAGDAARRVDEVAATAGDAARRVDEVAGDAARRADELAATADETLAAVRRAEQLAAESAELGGRVDDLEARVGEVDRGAGAVRSDVRGLRERLDEVSTIARSAQEAADGGRSDADELRASVARLGGELEATRSQVEHAGQEALGAREQAAAAGEAAAAARDDADRVREEAAAMRRELDAGAEQLTALGGEVERTAGTAGAAATAAEEARAEAAAAQAAGERTASRLAELDERARSLRTEMATGRERLDALGGRMERLGKDVVEAGQAAGAARTAAEAQSAELRDELVVVRRVAEQARDGLDALRSDIDAVRADSQSVRDDAAAARLAAQGGERRVEAMQAELTYAMKALEDLKAGLTSAGQAAVIARREAEQAKRAAQNMGEGNSGVNEVFQQLLAAAGRGGQPSGARRSLTPGSEVRRRPKADAREARHGFDDVTRPLAILGLDGKFRELNPAFARLVGYQEHEFAKAAWPSPHDRGLYQQQQEELRQLVSGGLVTVSVQSTYMHGQGLMVPVVGKLTVVPGEDGLPLHLLLEAEERTTG